jgi:hypothetical protein
VFSLAQSRQGEAVLTALMNLVAVSGDGGAMSWEARGSGETEESGPWREEAVLVSLFGRHPFLRLPPRAFFFES